MGYVQPSVNVSESGGVAQLTVNTAMPSGGIPNELSIFLIVDTSDETAIGLEFRVGFSVLYSPLYPCFYDNGWNIDSIYILTGRYHRKLLMMFPITPYCMVVIWSITTKGLGTRVISVNCICSLCYDLQPGLLVHIQGSQYTVTRYTCSLRYNILVYMNQNLQLSVTVSIKLHYYPVTILTFSH